MSSAILGAVALLVVGFVLNLLWALFGPLPGRPDDEE